MQNLSLIDWIGFTLPQEYTWPKSSASFIRRDITPVLMELFNLDPRNLNPKVTKSNWYREHYTISTDTGKPLLHVLTGPTADQNGSTTAFAVTGYALSARSDALSKLDPVDLIRKVHKHNGNLTRIDAALDDFSGKPILQNMIEASAPDVWRDRTVTSLCRSSKPLAIWDETVYYGHRDRGSCICAYDKAKEQGVNFPWFRCEFRTRDRDLLKTIKQEIVSGKPVGELTAGLIGHYLRFVPASTTSSKTKYNRPTCSWWSDLLVEGATFELKRHSAGKVDDDPRRGPAPAAVTRYLTDAIKHDDTGEIRNLIIQFAGDLKLSF